MDVIMILVLKASIGVLAMLYGVLKNLPTNNKKILCISRQENQMSLDYQLLINEIQNKDEQVKIVFISSRDDGGLKYKFKFLLNILRSMYHLATAKICILDAYWPAVSILSHKSDLKIIQMWHSIGKVKKSGYQTVGAKTGRNPKIAKMLKMHRNYDYVIAGSEVFNEYYCKGFDISREKILNLGLPRIDHLINDEETVRDRIYEKYPMFRSSEKKVILYVPTFRKNDSYKKSELVAKTNYDDYIFIMKAHANQKLKIDSEGVWDCPEFKAIELLTIADYVITDYSAIALEAAIIDKKTLYYIYDYEEYIADNGLNIDPLKVVPEYSFKKLDEVFEVIDSETYDDMVLKRYKETFLPENLGESTKKISDTILALM